MISDDEIIYYLHEEWQKDKSAGRKEVWLSTQAFQKKLAKRGIVISWLSVEIRMKKYAKEGKIARIETSFGPCWMSKGEEFTL